VSTSFLEPTEPFTTSRGSSLGLGTTAFYDWTARQWTEPIELSASQIVRIGKRPASVGLKIIEAEATRRRRGAIQG
jgi:hypothetical protein